MAIGRHRSPAMHVSIPVHQPAGSVAEAPRSDRGISIQQWWQIRVNPILLQPRLVANSLSQPITSTGYNLWRRTGMSPTAVVMQGRWAVVGHVINGMADRGSMAGLNLPGAYGSPANTYAAPGYAPRRVALKAAPPV